MKNETILRGCLVLLILILLWETIMWNNTIMVVNNQKNTIDSLIGELQVQESITDYYDRLWEQISEKYPKEAKIIEHETE